MLSNFLVLTICFYLFLNKTIMSLLLNVIALSIMFIMMFFLYSLDYWFSFMIIMSFLVGLFLLFVYLVSLVSTFKYEKAEKNLKMLSSAEMMMIFFSMMFCLLVLDFSFIQGISSKKQSLEWMFEDINEILGMTTLIFVLFIIFLFFFMKKNKKMMKSTK